MAFLQNIDLLVGILINLNLSVFDIGLLMTKNVDKDVNDQNIVKIIEIMCAIDSKDSHIHIFVLTQSDLKHVLHVCQKNLFLWAIITNLNLQRALYILYSHFILHDFIIHKLLHCY